MTYDRREEIFSKETITTEEIAEVLEISRSSAQDVMRRIKLKSDRLGIKGRVLIQDYLDYFGINEERYRRTEQ